MSATARTRYADDWTSALEPIAPESRAMAQVMTDAEAYDFFIGLAPVTPLFATREARHELNRWAIARLRQKRAARTQLAVRALFYSVLAFALTGTAWLFLLIMAAVGDRV